MTTYNTQNPLGSTDPRDLYDNSQVFDEMVNNTTDPTVQDRFGNTRITLANQLGYNLKGDYAAGIELISYTDIIRYNSEFYRPSASATLPYTTTATLPDVDSNLVPVGDATLRQELALNSAGNGSDLISHTGTPDTVTQALDKRTVFLDTITDLQSVPAPVDGQHFSIRVFYDSEPGSVYFYDAAAPKSSHDGFYTISPTVPSIDSQSGATVDDKIVNFLSGAGEPDATGSGCFIRKLTGSVEATEFPGTTLSRKIQNAFNVLTSSGTTLPATIYVSPKTPAPGGVAYYDWDTAVDISADSGISVIARGTVYVKATAPMSSMIKMGISNKNNQTEVSGFSFNCGDQLIDAAILIGSCRGIKIRNIELKADSGSFTDGVLFGGDDIHTGTEPGSGNERSSVIGLHDSGDSAVTRSMVHFSGGTSYGVTVSDVRATGGNWQQIVGCATSAGFSGCTFEDFLATFAASRLSPANAFVHLQRSANNVSCKNFTSLGSVSGSCDYGVLINNISSPSGGIHADNVGREYAIRDVLYTGVNVISVFLNGVTYNKGDPNSSGALSSNPAIRSSGGVVRDTTNNTIYFGPEDFSESSYRTPLYRRIQSIADDGVLQLQFDPSDPRCAWSVVSVSAELSVGRTLAAIASLRFSSGNQVASKMTNTTDVDVTTGALTGTTGTDGNITISASEADNSIYIENRTGGPRQFNVSFLSG